MDSEKNMRHAKTEESSFSESSLLQMRKDFKRYLFLLVTLLICVCLFIFLFSFEVLNVFENILVNYGLKKVEIELNQDLHIADSLLNQERLRFQSAAQTFAMLPSVQQVITDDSFEEKHYLLESFIKFANIESPEILYIVDKTGLPQYANVFDEQDQQLSIVHDLLESALTGSIVSSFRLEENDWSQRGKTEIDNDTEDSEGQEFSEKTEKKGLYILASVPVYKDGEIIGAVLAGELINKNVQLLEKVKGILFNSDHSDSVFSVLLNNHRIASTYIEDQGYVVDTVINQTIDISAIEAKKSQVARLKLMNTDFYCAFMPLVNEKEQIVAVLEIGVNFRQSIMSYQQLFRKIKLSIYILLAIVGILGFVLAYFLSRLFSNRIFVSLNSMTQDIALLINKITDASSRVRQASAEILKSSEEQAAYFSQQAASINETTATMEELATVTKQIANYAEQVVTIAQQTTQNAQKGYQSVLDTIESMKEIKKKNETSAQEIMALGEKSQKISQVMRLINSIASQTKLIAFNASIEASAAGDIGKRFGVVATEVRRLTENVVHSTNDIKNIITEIQKSTNRLVFVSEEETKKIDDGVLLSEGSGKALQEILQIVSKTNQAAKQISLITQQQRTASDQVVTALKDISVGANEAVKSSKNINTAILQLDELSSDMSSLVQKSAAFIKQEEAGMRADLDELEQDE